MGLTEQPAGRSGHVSGRPAIADQATTDSYLDAWQAYATTRSTGGRTTNTAGERTWFNWTQYPDHGPGLEQLGIRPGARVLELGCGSGRNLAHAAVHGAECVGLDLVELQVERARRRWTDVPGLLFLQAEAVAYLSRAEARFDAVFSVFGPAWFTDPELLLPLVLARLSPGGVFAFSQLPAIDGCHGRQGHYMRMDEVDARPVLRWDHPVTEWPTILADHGYVNTTAEILAPPTGQQLGTLLVRGERP